MTPNRDSALPMPLTSRFAHLVWGGLLDGPAGPWVERTLVWFGHKLVDRSWPGRGAAIGQIARKNAGRTLIATLCGGVQIEVPAIPEGVGLYLTGGISERGTVRLFRRFWRPGQVFFDIGANMGTYTFLAAKSCGPSGGVHAFEPQAALTSYLERSARLNKALGAVSIIGAAVSTEHGAHALLFHAPDRTGTGIPSLLAHEWLDTASGDTVPTISVDGYRKERAIEKIDSIKIDVEGAELLVLKGMHQTLLTCPPTLLVIEVSPPTFNSIADGKARNQSPMAATPMDVVEHLTSYGYEARHIGNDGLLGAIHTADSLRSIDRAQNVGFVPPPLKRMRPELFL